MINITDKRNCTGCGACVNICPRNVITIVEDGDGFVYPKVDAEGCIECHLCEKSCPMLKDMSEICKKHAEFPQFYAGQLKNRDDLLEVSSGGAFWAFAQIIIEAGGVVYGAVQEDVDHIYHVRADNLDGIKNTRRSKYFQSETGATYRQTKEDLKKGLTVLYSGTGCQIAGLKGYLGKEYEHLITCDVVCHGVPSRKVWQAYRREKEEREGKKISELVFRDKSAGWSHNQYKITYQDGSIEKEASTRQLFHAGYLKGLFYRPSCGCCRFASLPRAADVTLADYWRYEGRFHQQGFDLGVSLITVNSEKGSKLLRLSSKYLEYDTIERTLALKSCKHLDEHPSENPDRPNFFKVFSEAGYYAAAREYIKAGNDISLIKRIVRKFRILVRL
ncbi:MAG: Coenzyme F420 hydrogenase/dehydrogenase, beta subunit C-terminal domain [Bacteroidales bacterium]|nr:Coenzyme F420 hydrogenase/dehydrogenase, beta subunit C-terminal domain [Bacteroidales bacterium]